MDFETWLGPFEMSHGLGTDLLSVSLFFFLLGPWSPNSSGKHDSTLCQSQGRLVDKHSSLQQGTYPPWCHSRQNCL